MSRLTSDGANLKKKSDISKLSLIKKEKVHSMSKNSHSSQIID